MNSPLSLIRLAGLPLSLTLISILAGSVINRVMVVELGLPVILAGLFLSIPLLVAPVRIWLGHCSDAYPLWGRRREPYLILGAVLSGAGAAGAVALVVKTPALFSIGTALILLALCLYGLGRNLAGNTFQALLADRFAPGLPRSRAVNLYEVVKLLGMVMGAGLVGQALRPYSEERLTLVVGVCALLAVILSLIAAIGQEPRTEALRQAAASARTTPFWASFRTLVWRDPQARLFLTVITLTLLGTQMQDVLMEPFAGLLLGVWGLGHQLGRALASLLGAALVDAMNTLTGQHALLAYGTAFMVEAGLLLGALAAFGHLHIESATAMREPQG